MNRVAIISDIHSNIDGLEAVLKDIKKRDIETIYCTGDLVEYFPFPNEVVNRIKEAGVISIMGNHDLAVVEGKLPSEAEKSLMTEEEIQSSGSNIFTLETMTKENVEFLTQLPRALCFKLSDLSVKLVHGQPYDISGYIRVNSEEFESFACQFEEDVLVSGHTHLPFHQKAFGKHFVNAGSAGYPKHGCPNPTYVILEVEDGNLKVDVVEVSYKSDDLIKAIEEEPRIANALIERIEKGI